MIFVILFSHNVSKKITTTDQRIIARFLSEQNLSSASLRNNQIFSDQIQSIQLLQQAVLDYSTYSQPIPKNTTREPLDFINAKTVNCFDRARFLDKAFRFLGYESRYVSAYLTEHTGSLIKSLITNNKKLVRSHALLEVKTVKGWVAVGTVHDWIGLTADHQTISLDQSHYQENGLININWHPENTENPYWILQTSYAPVYGLYSRHGRYYPPFTFIPDFNLYELLYNL